MRLQILSSCRRILSDIKIVYVIDIIENTTSPSFGNSDNNAKEGNVLQKDKRVSFISNILLDKQYQIE